MTAGFFSTLVGVATFPLLTRSLSVEDYGLVGLILSTLTLFIAIGKFGLQHSIIRFYSEVIRPGHTNTEARFYSTTQVLGLALATLTAVLCITAGVLIAPGVTETAGITGYFVAGALYIFLCMLGSNMSNVLIAQLKSRTVMLSTVIRRVVYLTTLLLFLFTSLISVGGVISAFVFAELICLLYLLFHCLPGNRHSPGPFSPELAKELMRYGIALMLLETMGLLMRISDRYIIQSLMDEAALGQYAASHNFVGYLEVLVLAAMISTLKPIYINLWESKGREATRDFLANGLHIYLLISIPFAAVFSLTAPHAIKLLASESYAVGTKIIPWVTAAMVVEGAILFVAAGIHIAKNTWRLVWWGLAAVLSNIALNFLIIPHSGILGASVVTFLTYCLYCFGLGYSAFKVLNFPITLRSPLIMIVASLLVWLALRGLPIDNNFTAIFIKGSVATCALLCIGLLIDSDLRKIAQSGYTRLLH